MDTKIVITSLATIPAFMLGSLTATDTDKLSTIIEEQTKQEEYVQVIDGQQVGFYKDGGLKVDLPPNIDINVHGGPEGDGYSVVTTYNDRIVSVGIGAYSSENTWVEYLNVATSTK